MLIMEDSAQQITQNSQIGLLEEPDGEHSFANELGDSLADPPDDVNAFCDARFMRKRLHDPMAISVESLGSFSNESLDGQVHPAQHALEEQHTELNDSNAIAEVDAIEQLRERKFNQVVRIGERLRRQLTP